MIILPLPTFLSANNDEVIPLLSNVTLSEPNFPCKLAPLLFTVAVVVPSYVLLVPNIPVIVKFAFVIFAVVVPVFAPPLIS